MSGELKILGKNEAAATVYDGAYVISRSVALFKSALNSFVLDLYPKGYALVSLNDEAKKVLEERLGKESFVITGPLKIFSMSYAEQFLLFKAGEHKLPVAMIKAQLVELVGLLYANGFAFVTGKDDESTEKMKNLLESSSGSVLLVLK